MIALSADYCNLAPPGEHEAERVVYQYFSVSIVP
jgi:hypothetical protein